MNILHRLTPHRLLLGAALLLGTGAIALAAIAPDVANTRHNLSASNSTPSPLAGSSFGTTVKATSETQICVFCHTPHAATTGIVAPLWNRTLSSETYTFYSSSSLDSTVPGAVGIGSKLCLSCHDGTLAIGTVGVLNNAPGIIAMQGTAGGAMPAGAGVTTGFTRNIGINLTNDHPISFTYDAALAATDGELYAPAATTNVAVANRMRGQPKPQFPLIGGADKFGGQMECITCHDPHLKTDDVDSITGQPVNNKFLRGNRFQISSPTASTTGLYDPAKDIICLACHNKPTWATSTHANKEATSEIYTDTAADLRDFPRNISTWKAACSNCHDMHTVPGSRRLLREATAGGSSAIEQVCFQCHRLAAGRILVQDTPDQVPDIQTDFSLTYRMPIVTAEQGQVVGGVLSPNTTEVHDIGVKATSPTDTTYPTSPVSRGNDFVETRTLMGANNLANRHAECTDCHQPHRVTRTQLFNGDPTIPAITGTHRHAGSGDPGGVPHNNLASGSQRGHFGVEPEYSSNSFFSEPTNFVEKRGPVATGAPTPIGDDTSATYLTREYQICAKCHSNYSFGTNPPSLGRSPGGTPYKTNGMLIYTDVFREIQAPVSHRGNAVTSDSGAFKGTTPYASGNYTVDFQIRNRRSWHPVMGPTGRTPALRIATASNWLWPWTNDVGNLTMYCTDCHGSNTAAATVMPTGGVDGNAWGPHGSTNIFILKGWWDTCTGTTPASASCLSGNAVSNSAPANTAVRPNNTTTNDLCFKCHSYNVYAIGGNENSGFGGPSDANLHRLHYSRINNTMRCMWCHVAVPHGWKNKAFLVNLNDVGPEATCRQEDADDAATGYKCTQTVGLGNPMPYGTQVRNGPSPNPAGPASGSWADVGYTNPPYYRNALDKIVTFAASGNWNASNCGSVGAPGNGQNGGCGGWMRSNEGCPNPP